MGFLQKSHLFLFCRTYFGAGQKGWKIIKHLVCNGSSCWFWFCKFQENVRNGNADSNFVGFKVRFFLLEMDFSGCFFICSWFSGGLTAVNGGGSRRWTVVILAGTAQSFLWKWYFCISFWSWISLYFSTINFGFFFDVIIVVENLELIVLV